MTPRHDPRPQKPRSLAAQEAASLGNGQQFAGHGFLNDRGQGYLAPSDVSIDNIGATGLPMEELGQAIGSKIRAAGHGTTMLLRVAHMPPAGQSAFVRQK